MVKQVAQLPKPHKTLLLILTFIVSVSLLLPSENAGAHALPPLEVGKPYELNLLLDELEELPEAEAKYQDVSVTVRSGDSLALMFARHDLTPQDVYRVVNSGKAAKRLTKLKPGDEIVLRMDDKQELQEVHYQFALDQRLVIHRDGQTFSSVINESTVEVSLGYISGTISTNFWAAGVNAGLTDNQIMRLADIFSWDIDFALEIRKGDQFHMVYEKRYINGEFVGYGDIVAAEFVNQGDSYAAVRFDDGNYYTPEGRSMRKSFLRAPVNFKYISSNFSLRRFHPVQKRYKAHRGIDYAASTGTPVVAAGDGKVIKASYNKYNGNYVFIQHGERYITKYLHFSKRAVKTGATVKQGQVIGYVGATGLAAGPHLHYEFLVDGVHRNPRTVKLPKAKPISSGLKSEFVTIKDKYMSVLGSGKRIMLAQN